MRKTRYLYLAGTAIINDLVFKEGRVYVPKEHREELTKFLLERMESEEQI